MQCKAYSRRNQGPCRQHAMRGKDVCRMHGGKSWMGPGSATFRHGRRSKFLPSRLAAAYQDAMSDPKLMELRQEIALVDARIQDLLSRVDTGEAGEVWHKAQAAMMRFEREKAKQNLDGMQLALNRLQTLITRGASDYATWHEIGEQIEQRRKLCDSEARRLHLAHDTLTADRAMVLLAVIVDTVRRHVQDRAVLGAIAADLQALGMGGVADGGDQA
jgi:hypothetical protein